MECRGGIIEQVDRYGIKMFAVCDHDEIGCVPEIETLLTERNDLEYIRGVEISTEYKGREHHILTYGIDVKDQSLRDILLRHRNTRDAYNEGLILFLQKSYPHLSLDDYNNYDYFPYQGGWYMYCYLTDRNVINKLSDYFSVIKGYEYQKDFTPPEELLSKLNALGYTTILAHPPAYQDGDFYDTDDLDFWRKLGVKGIECYTQYLNNQANAQYYVSYCNKHSMMITGGSDCHGGFAGRRLGYPRVTKSMIRFKY